MPEPTPPHPALTFLLALFAGWANRHQQRVIEYLVEENRVLRSNLGKRRVRLTDDERRRLARLGKALGRMLLTKVATIVTPDTILRWHGLLVARKWTYPKKGPGRPPVMKEIRELVVKIARENRWGNKRIQGALQNPGHKVVRTTISKILKENGLSPAPDRATSWKTFLKSHWQTLAAADFFTVEVWTFRGLRTIYVLFVIRLATRKVEIAGITDSPDRAFMQQAARNLTDPDGEVLRSATHMIIDRDRKYSDEFKSLLRAEDTKGVPAPKQAPDRNAFAERWIRGAKEEILNRLIFFGPNSLLRALDRYVLHHQRERNHQGIGNFMPFPDRDDNIGSLTDRIKRRERLGGLLSFYHREAG